MTQDHTRRNPHIPSRPFRPVLERETATGLQVVALNTTLLIGRDGNCDLCLDIEFVSLRHARVTLDHGNYILTDLHSTNGTFVNGHPLLPEQPYILIDGDVLCLDDPANADSIRLRFRAGTIGVPTHVHALTNTAVTLGRTHADIILDHPQVSRHHARIEVDQAGYSIVDLNSTNGTFVNGHPITQTLLQLDDIIQIGTFRFVYQGDHLKEYDQRGTLRVEAQQLSYRAGNQLILQDVSLTIKPRSLVAIVGASGAGKSTLLGLLAGHATPDQGRVLLGGTTLAPSMAAIGFVPQEEALHRTLPTERALMYAARLRLPADTSANEITERVHKALAEVGLTDRRSIPIGALSGGQRRRVAIAAELLADPVLFVLDEPTAGLDPGLERRLFATLRTLANSGRTVIVATHATTSLGICDQIVFLAHGRLVYDGPPAAAPAFFGVDDLAEIYALLTEETNTRTEAMPPRIDAMPPRIDAMHGVSTDAIHRVAPIRQFAVLTERALELVYRDRRNLAILLAQAPAIGLLLALVARADALVGERAAANEAKKVLFILATTAVWFGIINAARTIAGEWAVYRRERLAGVQIGAYVCSKVVALMPLLLIQALTLLLLVALKVQLPATSVFLPLPIELLITTFLAGLTGTTLGLVISAAATTPDRATSLVPLALIPQILFAGAIFSLGDGISIQRVLSWLTASRWALDAFGASANLNSLPVLPGMLRPLTPAPEYLNTPIHLFSSWLMLLAYSAICLLSTAVILWRKR